MYFEFTTKLNRKEMEAQKSRQKAFRVIVVEEHDTTVQIHTKEASIQRDS